MSNTRPGGCAKMRNGFRCTRKHGHKGQHECRGPKGLYTAWRK